MSSNHVLFSFYSLVRLLSAQVPRKVSHSQNMNHGTYYHHICITVVQSLSGWEQTFETLGESELVNMPADMKGMPATTAYKCRIYHCQTERESCTTNIPLC